MKSIDLVIIAVISFLSFLIVTNIDSVKQILPKTIIESKENLDVDKKPTPSNRVVIHSSELNINSNNYNNYCERNNYCNNACNRNARIVRPVRYLATHKPIRTFLGRLFRIC